MLLGRALQGSGLLPDRRDITYLALDRLTEVHDPATLAAIQQAFAKSLQLLWLVLLIPTAIAMFVSCMMEDLKISTVIESDYGLRDDEAERVVEGSCEIAGRLDVYGLACEAVEIFCHTSLTRLEADSDLRRVASGRR